MQIYAILPLRVPLKLCCVSLSCCGITVYQFTEHYITNANTVPMLILLFLYEFRGTWQADKQRLCGKLIRRCAACHWLVNAPAVPTNRCHLNVNQGKIKHATPTAGQPGALAVAKPVRGGFGFDLSAVKRLLQLTKSKDPWLLQDKKTLSLQVL